MLNEAITDLVCEVYQRVLGIETVRPEDNFFSDLGGDSLSLAQAVSYIYDLLNVDIMEAMTTTSTSPASLALFIAPRLQQARGQLRQPSTSIAPESLVQAAKRVHELTGTN